MGSLLGSVEEMGSLLGSCELPGSEEAGWLLGSAEEVGSLLVPAGELAEDEEGPSPQAVKSKASIRNRLCFRMVYPPNGF